MSHPSSDSPSSDETGMVDPELEAERRELRELSDKPTSTRLAYYMKRSGPGWLQGAITLGGGSLAGAMYLGVIAGFGMMWLQPLAMIFGVIMLSAIAYVTLSTEQRPFAAINRNVSPVLGWAWLIAAGVANIVWCMPQFNLARASVQQNLLGMEGDAGLSSTVAICLAILALAFYINYLYMRGASGLRTFEIVLKVMVAVVVLSFFGVVGAITLNGNLAWGEVFRGLIPDLGMVTRPAEAFTEPIAATGAFADYWRDTITAMQRDRMMTAFGTAVGINMTFILPYSMLRKRWGKEHRGLAIFDLAIGLIIPFVLATSCVVIAAASQFHGQTADVLDAEGNVNDSMKGAYHKVLDKRLEEQVGGDELEVLKSEGNEAGLEAARAALPASDRRLAAMLANRDNMNLAQALEPLTGKTVAQLVFGVGVLGMAVSTIIMLMLISGYVFCEALNRPGDRAIHLMGTLVAGIGGFFGPFIWGNDDARAALAVPTSVIGGALIPIAYLTFLLLMNSRSLLGDRMPTGFRRVRWNVLMALATLVLTIGSVWVLWEKSMVGIPMGKLGVGLLALLFVLGVIGFVRRQAEHARTL